MQEEPSCHSVRSQHTSCMNCESVNSASQTAMTKGGGYLGMAYAVGTAVLHLCFAVGLLCRAVHGGGGRADREGITLSELCQPLLSEDVGEKRNRQGGKRGRIAKNF